MAITQSIFGQKAIPNLRLRRGVTGLIGGGTRGGGAPSTATQPQQSAPSSSGGSSNGGGVSVGGNEVPGGGSSGVAALPFDASALFPEFSKIKFPSVKTADFKFTDPIDYAKQFSDFNRFQIKQNYSQAGDQALEALRNELKGIQGYVPAAGALAREQTALDNPFNQGQRTSQVNSVLPNARGDLSSQRDRALTYAGGDLPFADRARELGVRGRAADTASFAGFGANSAQAAKTSDLMSAEERFQIAQYGEGLLGSNLSEEANLFLAPTEYSSVGSKVNVMPEVGAGRLTASGAESINGQTLISPTTGLQATIQQRQFKTNLDQQVKEFNASGQFEAARFNSSGGFAAGLGLFNYQTGYLSQIQAGNQANLNTAAGLNANGINAQNYNSGLTDAQSGQTITSTLGAIGALPQTFGAISQALGYGGTSQTSPTPAAPPQTIGASGADFSQSAPSMSLDASAPFTYKLSPGSSAPSGYTQISSDPNGAVSVADNSAYQGDMSRFARSYNIPQGDLNVASAAQADKSLSSAAGLSFLPAPGMAQTALAGNGKPVYSLPSAAGNTNSLAGRDSVAGTALTIGALGIGDSATLDPLMELAGQVSDPDLLSSLDEKYSKGGGSAVADEIASQMLGGGFDPSSKANQQVIFGAGRAGELWGGLSPFQKSMALTSLVGPAMESKTGQPLAQREIPGSKNSVAGPLKVGDVVKITAAGINGFSLARNWGQLSAMSDIVGNSKSPEAIAAIMDHTGMLGYGPQGASVKVDINEIRNNGRPAPEFGVGAMHFDGAVPQNFKPLAKTALGTVGIPENLIHTSPFSYGHPATVTEKAAQVAEGKHPGQRIWASLHKPAGAVVRGGFGGSAIISSLALMQKSNSAVSGSIFAHALFNNTIGNDMPEATNG